MSKLLMASLLYVLVAGLQFQGFVSPRQALSIIANGLCTQNITGKCVSALVLQKD